MKKRTWLREAGVYLLMYGIPLAVLFPWSGWRPDAQFVATLKTRAVDFTVGRYEGAGFAGDRADISFESFDHVELPDQASCAPVDGKIQFRNVKFQSLPLPGDTKVRIEWYPQAPTGARMVVQYPGVPPQAKVFLDDRSSAAIGTCKLRGVGAGLGAAKVYPKAGQPLILNLDPVSPDSRKPVELAFDQSRQMYPAPHGLRFRLPDQSAITGSDGNVLVLNADRKEPVRPGTGTRNRRIGSRHQGDGPADRQGRDCHHNRRRGRRSHPGWKGHPAVPGGISARPKNPERVAGHGHPGRQCGAYRRQPDQACQTRREGRITC